MAPPCRSIAQTHQRPTPAGGAPHAFRFSHNQQGLPHNARRHADYSCSLGSPLEGFPLFLVTSSLRLSVRTTMAFHENTNIGDAEPSATTCDQPEGPLRAEKAKLARQDLLNGTCQNSSGEGKKEQHVT